MGFLSLPRGYIHVLNHEENCIKSGFKDIFLKLVTNEWSDKTFLLTSKFCPLGTICPCPGTVHMYKSWKKKSIKSDFKEIFLKLATNDRSDTMFLLTSKFHPQGVISPCPGAMYIYKSWKKKVQNQTRVFWNLQQMTEVTRCSCWHQNFIWKGLSAPALGLYTCIKSWKNCIKSDFKEIFLKLATNDRSDTMFLMTLNFHPQGVVSPCPGTIYMYKIMKTKIV